MDFSTFERHAANLAQNSTGQSPLNLLLRGQVTSSGLWVACAPNEVGFSTLVAIMGAGENRVITTDVNPGFINEGKGIREHHIAALSRRYLWVINATASLASRTLRRQQ